MRCISRIYALVGLVMTINITPCFSTQTAQPQGPAQESQKVEQPVDNKEQLNRELFNAVLQGRQEKAEELLSLGANVNARIGSGNSVLHFIVIQGTQNMAHWLLVKGALVDAKDNQGRTPLHYVSGAIRPKAKRNPEMVKILVKSGADVNAADNEGLTPLHHAVKSEFENIVKSLIDSGAEVNVQDRYGLTPLHYAVEEGNKEITLILLEHNAAVDAKDSAGRAPIHYAAEAAYMANIRHEFSVDMIRLLIDNGADINDKDNLGWTPLHYAACACKEYLVEILVEKEADVDAVDNRGRTPSVVMQERLKHLETLRGSQAESTIPPEYRKGLRAILRLLHEHKNGRIHIVAPNEKKTNEGSDERSFAAIAAAIETAKPGDVILIHGGTYVCPSAVHIDKSGKQGNPIRLAAYPGELVVLDFAKAQGDAVFISGAYWHIKGIAITHATRPIMIYGSGAHHNILEQVRAFGNQYAGIFITTDGPAHNVILNCDAYQNFDPQKNGQNADGFGICWNVGPGNVLIGDRSWNNSDDGYDCWYANNSVRFERCYAWRNGKNIWRYPFFVGNGNGFKLGRGSGKHILIGCLSWGHKVTGATINGNRSGVIIKNCTFFDNETNYFFEWTGWPEEGRKNSIFINNISYEGHSRDRFHPEAINRNNSWSSGLGITLDDDFLSLDDSQMSAPRNPDGSIPYNNFLRLAPGSSAIDKGTDVGMPYIGKAPDLGAFEYDPNRTPKDYVKMLHQAVRDHDKKEINRLLTAGQGINDKDWLGYTPLHWAVYFGYPDLIEMLIAKGADPNIQSDTGRYALEIARAMAYPELEALLRKLGAKAGDTDEN